MKAVFRVIVMIIAVFFVILISLISLSPNSTNIDKNLTVSQLVATQQELLSEKNINIDQISFQDNPEIYKDDVPSSVVTIFITVMEKDLDTWAAMNEYKSPATANDVDTTDQNVEAIVQFGND